MSVSIVLHLGAFVLLAQHALAVNQGIGSCNATHATELDNLSDKVFDRAITKTQAHAKLAPKTLADMEPLCKNADLLMAVAKRTAESCVTDLVGKKVMQASMPKIENYLKKLCDGEANRKFSVKVITECLIVALPQTETMILDFEDQMARAAETLNMKTRTSVACNQYDAVTKKLDAIFQKTCKKEHADFIQTAREQTSKDALMLGCTNRDPKITTIDKPAVDKPKSMTVTAFRMAQLGLSGAVDTSNLLG